MKRSSFMLISSIFLISCTNADLTSVNSPDSGGNRRSADVKSSFSQTPRTYDDDLHALALSVEGITGVAIGTEGQLIISTTNPDLSPRQIETVRDWVSNQVGQDIGRDASVHVRVTNFSFIELERAYKLLLRRLPRESQFTLGDIDEATGVVRLASATQSGADLMRDVAASLNLPEGMVEVSVEKPVQLLQTLRSAERPTFGGLQISISGDSEACTLGMNVYAADYSGNPDPGLGRFFLTASHCTTLFAQLDSSIFGQPIVYQHEVGVEVADAERMPVGSAYCQVSFVSWCIFADAAVVKYRDSVPSYFGVVATSNAYTGWDPITHQQPIPPAVTGWTSISNGITGAMQGMLVTKVGRTSGQTQGAITATCVDAVYDNAWTVLTLCSSKVGALARPGDSGAPVYVTAGTYPQAPWPVGILWGDGGDGYFYSPLNLVGLSLGGGWFW